MESKRMIVTTPEEARYLAAFFKVSHVTVWAALNFRKSNLLHKRIRKMAIERGSVPMVLSPEFETIYLTNREDADHECKRYMVQTFANGATLEGCLTTGRVEIRNRHGESVQVYDNPKVTELKAIQDMAYSL